MSAWTFFYIYLTGAALVALRVGWYIRYRLDKYDRMYCDVRFEHWTYSLFWPLVLLFAPKSLIAPAFTTSFWNEGRAETERVRNRLEANPPTCTAFIRYVPEDDASGKCDSEFVFDAAEVGAIMAKRLAELPAEQHDRYSAILNWLRQRDPDNAAPTDVPKPWNGHFLNVAVGMMNRGMGQVKCGQCGAIVAQDQISLDSCPTGVAKSGWVFKFWCCPRKHKLLTKDAIHFHIRKLA